MNEIAQMTYNQYVGVSASESAGLDGLIDGKKLTGLRSDFVEIMEMMDKRMNDKGKNWRHVFKVRPLGWASDRLNCEREEVV